MTKLNWWRSTKLYGRQTVDHRHEHDIPDKADRWLAAVNKDKKIIRHRPRERHTFSGSTQAS
jgi:ABC-type phosphonate transport system ATPase subunit